jgi:hypothetical protein
MKITFRTPSGQEQFDPALAMLRDRVLNGDEDYWCVGSGDGSLEATLESGTAVLSLVLKEPYGFLLRYGTYDSTDDFVSLCFTDFSTTVEASLGGNPWIVPAGFFVSREKAWEAVVDFCRSGHMSRSITWGRLDEQRWDPGT